MPRLLLRDRLSVPSNHINSFLLVIKRRGRNSNASSLDRQYTSSGHRPLSGLCFSHSAVAKLLLKPCAGESRVVPFALLPCSCPAPAPVTGYGAAAVPFRKSASTSVFAHKPRRPRGPPASGCSLLVYRTTPKRRSGEWIDLHPRPLGPESRKLYLDKSN